VLTRAALSETGGAAVEGEDVAISVHAQRVGVGRVQGIVPAPVESCTTRGYLDVTTAQNALLANQRSAIGIRVRRMTTSVLLVKALGGGWNSSRLPTSFQD